MKKFLLSAVAVCGFASMAMADYATGSLDAPLSVTEFLAGGAPAKDNGVAGTYVKGYIVGIVNGSVAEQDKFVTAAPFSLFSNIVIAASSSETELSRCIPVQLVSKTDARAALNLGDNPANLGHQVILEGTRETYMGVPGLKAPASYKWVGEAPTPGGGDGPVVGGNAIYTGLDENAASLTGWTIDTIEECPEMQNGIVTWKTYQNKSYLNFSTNGGGTPYNGIAMAYSEDIDLAGYTDVTVNFEHCAKFQTSLKELCWFGVREAGATEWVKLTIPTWPTAGAWTWGNSGDMSLKDYEGKKIQLCFYYQGSSELGADTWEVRNVVVNGSTSTAVEEVAVEEGEAVYFNLQGVQVANPANGIYVKVANGKATKVVVK